jgi:hypothetical protein
MSSLPQSPQLARSLEALRAYCIRESLDDTCVILCGFPKSGNTWFRFVYHNLIRVVNGGAVETLTYRQLNAANPNGGFPDGLASQGFLAPEGIDHHGFPLLLHGHAPWQPWWRKIGPVIYIHRNPLDCLIGLWYASQVFPVDVAQPQPVEAFVLQHLPQWISHHRVNVAAADVVVRYENLRHDDLGAFGAALAAVGLCTAPADCAKAVTMSRFQAIRRMEDEHGERLGHRVDAQRRARHGLAAWKNEPSVRFTRSGEVGQWRGALSRVAVDSAVRLLEEAGLGADAAAASLLEQGEAGVA